MRVENGIPLEPFIGDGEGGFESVGTPGVVRSDDSAGKGLYTTVL